MAHTVNMPDLFPVDNYTTVMDTERNIRTRYLKCEIIQYKIESNDTNVYTTNSTKSERSKCHHWVYDKKDFDVTFAMQVSQLYMFAYCSSSYIVIQCYQIMLER